MEKLFNGSINRQIKISLFALILCIQASRAIAAPVPPKIEAKAAIVVDALTGKVIYEKNSHMKRPPASTTKIMTAILALEHGGLNDVVTASPNVCETPFSSMHLKNGEQLTLYNLLYGMLLRSANDGAACIAEHIAGSQSKFVEMMNNKAKEIGANDTHFVNPHGLHDPDHYTTAYDLALIARYAIQFPVFNEIVGTKGKRIDRSINTQDVSMHNTARFLSKFQGADGIKTGHTKEAGRCFVGSATRDNWRVISVVLGSTDAGTDTIALMGYAFKYYKQVPFTKIDTAVSTVPVYDGIEKTIEVLPARNFAVIVNKSAITRPRTKIDIQHVSAPVSKGEKVGTMTAYIGDMKVGTIDLIAAKTINRTLAATLWLWVRNIFLVLFILISGLLIYGTAVAKAARQRRRRVAQAGRKTDNFRAS